MNFSFCHFHSLTWMFTSFNPNQNHNHIYNNKHKQLRRGSRYVARRKGMRRPQRMSRSAVHERCRVHKSGAAIALPVQLSGWVLGRELRTHSGGPNIEVKHGRIGSDSRMSADHPKWVRRPDWETGKGAGKWEASYHQLFGDVCWSQTQLMSEFPMMIAYLDPANDPIHQHIRLVALHLSPITQHNRSPHVCCIFFLWLHGKLGVSLITHLVVNYIQIFTNQLLELDDNNAWTEHTNNYKYLYMYTIIKYFS